MLFVKKHIYSEYKRGILKWCESVGISDFITEEDFEQAVRAVRFNIYFKNEEDFAWFILRWEPEISKNKQIHWYKLKINTVAYGRSFC